MCCPTGPGRYGPRIAWILLLLCVGAGLVVLMPPAWVRCRLPGVFCRAGIIPLGFVFLALGMTSPLVVQPGAMMIEGAVWKDAYIGVWNMWWTGAALLDGANPYFTDQLCAPGGTDLAMHTHSVTYGLLTLPLQWLLASAGGEDLFLVNNLVILLSFALTGYFTYRLAWRISDHRGAAILAGVMFAFCTYRFGNLSRLHVLATEWLVLMIWATVVFLARPSPRGLIAGAGAFVLLINASLEYTAYAALMALALGSAELLRRFLGRRAAAQAGAEQPRPAAATRAGWVAAVLATVVILAIGVGPFLAQFLTRLEDRQETTMEVASIYSADLLDLFLGNPRHPLWGEVFSDISQPLHVDGEGLGQQPGLLTWVLFCCGMIAVQRSRRGWRWVLGAGICLCLALGPRLRIAGQEFDGLLMPHGLLSEVVPFLGTSRTPFRWMGPAVLCMAMVAALGWARWRGRTPATTQAAGALPGEGRGPQPGGPELLATIAVLCLALPVPLTMLRVQVPEVYRLVAAADTDGQRSALLQLPGIRSRDSLLYQSVHRRPLIEDVRTSIPFNNGSNTAMGADWKSLVIQFGRPGAVSGLDAAARGALLSRVKNYLRSHRIRWVVVAAARGIHSMGLLGRHVSPRSLGPDVYQSYRENLRLLGPKTELERGAFTLFEF